MGLNSRAQIADKKPLNLFSVRRVLMVCFDLKKEYNLKCNVGPNSLEIRQKTLVVLCADKKIS